MAAPDFWDDPESARNISRKRAQLIDPLDRLTAQEEEGEEIQILFEMIAEEEDPELAKEATTRLIELDKTVAAEEMARLLSGPNDKGSAILAINSGAGGTESNDWSEMLLRMFIRWADTHDYKTKVLELTPGDEAGVKSVTVSIDGPNAFGYLRSEVGIHRLVRISPFDASGRRHTSFASVFVYPEPEGDIDIVVEDKDLRIDTYRASGHGGQHVNKTDSAVRITHLPTGIVAQCQNEKSQRRNKDMAMKVLKARLYEVEEEKRQAELDELHSTKKEISWGSQIRSYVLQPYRLIKDHRTNYEVGNVDAVLDGDLDGFINAFLIKSAAGEL